MNIFKTFVEPYKITYQKCVPAYSASNDVWEERHTFLSQNVFLIGCLDLGLVCWIVSLETGGAQSQWCGAGAGSLTDSAGSRPQRPGSSIASPHLLSSPASALSLCGRQVHVSAASPSSVSGLAQKPSTFPLCVLLRVKEEQRDDLWCWAPCFASVVVLILI